MITRFTCELNDTQRATLAAQLDGKVSKRMATRKEVQQFLQGSFDMLCESLAALPPAATTRNKTTSKKFDIAASHDDPHLIGKSEGYRRGWNQVKFRRGAKHGL